jgi:hypothetical protein
MELKYKTFRHRIYGELHIFLQEMRSKFEKKVLYKLT